MFPYKLLMANIPYSQSEKLVRAAMENGCTGGTVLQARSLAETNLSAVLGLQENSREIVLMIVESSLTLPVISAVKKAFCREKRNLGQLYSLEAGNFLKSGTNWELESESEVQNENLEVPMEKENQKTEKSNGNSSAMEMLTVIVNKAMRKILCMLHERLVLVAELCLMPEERQKKLTNGFLGCI